MWLGLGCLVSSKNLTVKIDINVIEDEIIKTNSIIWRDLNTSFEFLAFAFGGLNNTVYTAAENS